MSPSVHTHFQMLKRHMGLMATRWTVQLDERFYVSEFWAYFPYLCAYVDREPHHRQTAGVEISHCQFGCPFSPLYFVIGA